MVKINISQKKITCKVVYYGPGLSGKTTNLEKIHANAPTDRRGELTSIQTQGDRTLFFDFLPLDLGQVAGMRTMLQLYTVPGQVYYNATRKLVLQGVDGIVFVADSAEDKLAENKESMSNLLENLAEYDRDLADLPHVIQYNKRDLSNAMSIEELDEALNEFDVPSFLSVATEGEGVFPTLQCLAAMVIESVTPKAKSHKNRKPRAKSRQGEEDEVIDTNDAATSTKTKKDKKAKKKKD
jgi:signal recognition particle receptor subunit beta